MRRNILAVSAVALLFLGLEKVGVYQFVPGVDSGFQIEPLAGARGYSLRHANSAGNLTGWVQLFVQGDGSGPVDFVPLAWAGDPLAIVSRSLGDGRFEVTISKAPNPPSGTPFVWGAGLELQIAETNGASPTTVEDWAIFPSTQAPDRLGLATRRRLWTVISWVLLLIASVGTVLTALGKKGEAVTTRTLVSAIVDDIVGETPAETKKLRGFIRRVVLEEVPVQQALTQAGFPIPSTWPARKEQYQFHFRAVNLFRERVDTVLAAFERYRHRLAGTP